MEEKQKPCIMYVDYEGLLVRLSHTGYVDLTILLRDLLQKARQRFDIQHAVVFANWSYLPGRAQLETAGFLCRSFSANWTEISRMLQESIEEFQTTVNMAVTVILVSGETDHSQLLRTLLESKCESLLWTISAPSPSDQALCAQWEMLSFPAPAKAHAWQRQVILQAVALEADHLQKSGEAFFVLADLCDSLAQYSALDGQSALWTAIAARERILLLQSPQSSSELSYGYLNRLHPLVQKALLIRERILCTLSSLQKQREWVAFNVLERALSRTKLLAEGQSFRHAWLEMLSAQGVLIIGQVPQPGSLFKVTTLRLNPDHRAVAALLQRQQALDAAHLVVTINDFTIWKAHSWIPMADLLRNLTKAFTRVEARSIIRAAEEQKIIEIGSAPGNQAHPVTAISLRPDHPLVQETLARRDFLIGLAYATFAQRNTGTSETVLAEALTRDGHFSIEDAFFWINLMSNEGILHRDQIRLDGGEVAWLLSLADQHPVIDQVLSSNDIQSREVR